MLLTALLVVCLDATASLRLVKKSQMIWLQVHRKLIYFSCLQTLHRFPRPHEKRSVASLALLSH